MTFDSRLIELLTSHQGHQVFNQYAQLHPDHDLPDAPAVRLRNLIQFLTAFSSVRFILLAEAAGYRGCRFSGIPMTAEVNIVGPDRVPWAQNQTFHRSSGRDQLWRESSATILWETLGERTDCLIWNTFPWHPMGKRGPLSNRTPRRAEVEAGIEVLELILERYSQARPVAVGRVAERTLQALGYSPVYVRHPAHGGKPQFVAGIRSLCNRP